MRVAARLEDNKGSFQHVGLMVQGLRAIAEGYATKGVATLDKVIAQCVNRDLERLEAE